jgi:hypothetical protein
MIVGKHRQWRKEREGKAQMSEPKPVPLVSSVFSVFLATFAVEGCSTTRDAILARAPPLAEETAKAD